MQVWRVTFKLTAKEPEELDFFADDFFMAYKRVTVAIEITTGKPDFTITKLEKVRG